MTKAAEEKTSGQVRAAPAPTWRPRHEARRSVRSRRIRPRRRPPRKRLPRVESLTGLRWWAAFFVFSHHMTNLAPLPIYKFLKYGTSGVTFFFVLSGFVLTWSAQPGTKIRTFYRRRFARIWPAALPSPCSRRSSSSTGSTRTRR